MPRSSPPAPAAKAESHSRSSSASDGSGKTTPGATTRRPAASSKRLQQTEKKWLAAQEPAQTVADLQRQLDRFGRHYNTVRPHRALQRKTPAEAYTARPKAVPHGPAIKPHHRVRHDIIDSAGSITLRHESRLHHIGLGRLLAGTRVTVLVADLDITVINRETGKLLRELTLDPSRDYQPRGAKNSPQRPQKRE